MHGAFLKAVGLPCNGYKKGRRASELREKITGALADASGVPLPGLDSLRMPSELCAGRFDIGFR